MNDKLTCSERYGYNKWKKCARPAKYVYTGKGLKNGRPYCGIHARKFLPAELMGIELYQELHPEVEEG